MMDNRMNLNERFKQFTARSNAFGVFLSLGIVAIVGLFDYFTGFELNFFAF
jgi:hypothetical protein